MKNNKSHSDSNCILSSIARGCWLALALAMTFCCTAKADILANNFWPNPNFESGVNLNLTNGTPTSWNKGGIDTTIDQVETNNFVSPTHSLAVIDNSTSNYGQWYSDFIRLTPVNASSNDVLAVQWYELYNVTSGAFYVSVNFYDSSFNFISSQNYAATGNSAGWVSTIANSTFTKHSVTVTVPALATNMIIQLSSGGTDTGSMLIDDLSVVNQTRHPLTPVTISSGLTANNKTYDGTTRATISSNNIVLSGVLAADTNNVKLSTNGYSADFASTDVGTNISVTVSGLTLTGSAAGNYTLTQPTLSANIMAATGTVTLLKVMPLGDSITYGGTVPGAIPGGYRAPLSTLFLNAHYNMNTVGSMTDNAAAWVPQSDWPHEGHAGWILSGITAGFPTWISAVPNPDVITMLIGVNDFNNNIDITHATNRLDQLITLIATNRPNAKLFVANLLLVTYNMTVESNVEKYFNPYVPGIVAKHAALGQHVYFVDLHSALGALDLIDGLHPNQMGYNKMATNWFNAITNVMATNMTPSTPAGLTATAGNAQVSLTWNASSGATSYNVKRATTLGGPYTTVVSPTGTSYVNSGLANDGTTYYYQVSAVNAAGESSNSAGASATMTPSTPTGLILSVSNTQVSLSWTASFAATSYNVKRSTTSGGPYTNIATVSPPVVNFDVPGGIALPGTDPTTGGQSVVNYFGQGAYSDPGCNFWNAFAFKGVTAAGTNSDGITASPVTLTDVSTNIYGYGEQGAQGTVGGLESPHILESRTLTDTLNNVPAGVYNLYLYGKDDDELDANAGTTFTVSVGGTPYGTQSTVNSVTISFTSGNDYVVFSNVVVGAGGIITFIHRPNTAVSGLGGFNGLQLVSLPTYTDTGLTNGTAYYYEVSAVNVTGESSNSSQVSGLPPTPADLTATASNAQVSLSWTASSGTTSYNVKRSTTSGGPYTTIATVTPKVVNFDVPGGVSGGTNYSGQGAYSDSDHNFWNKFAFKGTTAAGTNSDGTVSPVTMTDASGNTYGVGQQGAQGTVAGLEAPFALNNGIVTNKLNNVPAGAYNLYLYGKNDDELDANRGTVFTLSVGGTSYGTNSTVNSMTASFTQGNDYVVFSNVVSASGVITFTYQPNPAISGNGEGDFNGLQLVGLPACTDTGLTYGTTYYYVVSALNANGESANSTQVSATTAPSAPTGLNAVGTNAAVRLTWTASSGATSYNVKRSTTSGAEVTVTNVTGTSFTNIALTNGMTYYYKVSALNAAGESDNSSEASAVPVAPPLVLTATLKTDEQFTLQFNGTDGQSYIVQTSTNLATGNWTSVYTNIQSGGVFIFTNVNTGNATLFYRVGYY